jgi:hypothetical protein
MVPAALQTIDRRSNPASGEIYIHCIELVKRLCEAIEVLLVLGVHDLEIEGRDGSAFQHCRHTSDNDELDPFVNKSPEERLKSDRTSSLVHSNHP